MSVILEPSPPPPSGDHVNPCGNRISHLPTELLIEIFKIIGKQPTLSNHCINHNIPSFSTPLLLGTICRRWRDISWSIPSLWNYIDLVLRARTHRVCADLLAEWLQRSKDLPLTIIFRRDESQPGSAEQWGEQMVPLFRLIYNEWQRWEFIDLFIPHRSCMPQIDLEVQQSRFLHTAVIRGNGTHAFPASFLSHTPNLRELTLDVAQFQPPQTPYAQLTRITTRAIAMDDIINLLTLAPNLHALFMAAVTSPMTNPKNILLESLETLKVVNSLSLHEFLNTIQAPRLQHLHLEGYARSPVEVEGVLPFIQEHGPLLESLVIAGFWEHSVAPLLAQTPQLRDLTLRRDGSRNATAFQESLAQDLARLPRLQSFRLYGVAGPCYLILDVIKSRWAPKRVVIRSDSVSPLETCPGTVQHTRIHTIGLSLEVNEEKRMATRIYLRSEIEDGLILEFCDGGTS